VRENLRRFRFTCNFGQMFLHFMIFSQESEYATKTLETLQGSGTPPLKKKMDHLMVFAEKL
jgi:hypothetical protein